MHKTYFNWSSGKDSALALYHIQKDKNYRVDRLITSVNSHYNRVSMHGLRKELLIKQAESINIPLEIIELPQEPSMEEYNAKMTSTVNNLKSEGYTHSVFGDIFLEDLKKYREEQLNSLGFKAVFPIWKRNTHKLMEEFFDLGFKAITVCIDSRLLDESFIGREVDSDFLSDLPDNIDPCGENGEFHTFCYDGPIFNEGVNFDVGEKVFREYKAPKTNKSEDVCSSDKSMGFWFCDLIP